MNYNKNTVNLTIRKKATKNVKLVRLLYRVQNYVNDSCKAGARFTKYLMTILRLSYDNAKVMIDLRRTSSLQNILRREQAFLTYDSLAKLYGRLRQCSQISLRYS